MIDILKLVIGISILHSCSINILFIVISYPLSSIAFNYAQIFELQFTSSRTRSNLFLYHDEVDHYISYYHIIILFTLDMINNIVFQSII